MADAGADVDEALAVGGGGGEDVRDGGHPDEFVLLLRLHVLSKHVSQALLKWEESFYLSLVRLHSFCFKDLRTPHTRDQYFSME